MWAMKVASTFLLVVFAMLMVPVAKADRVQVSLLQPSAGRVVFGTTFSQTTAKHTLNNQFFTFHQLDSELDADFSLPQLGWPDSWLAGQIHVQGNCTPSLIFVGFGNAVPQDNTCAGPSDTQGPGDLLHSPEPGTLTLFGAGLLGLAGLVRRRLMQ